MKNSKIARLFSRYIPPDRLERTLDDPKLPQMEERIIVLLTGEGEDKFSGKIIDRLSLLDLDHWTIESLNPIVLLTAKRSPESVFSTKNLILTISSLNGGICFIGGIASVKYGSISSGNRMAYGSSGVIITKLLEASITLPEGRIAMSEGLRDILNFEFNGRSYEVLGERFIVWKSNQ